MSNKINIEPTPKREVVGNLLVALIQQTQLSGNLLTDAKAVAEAYKIIFQAVNHPVAPPA